MILDNGNLIVGCGGLSESIESHFSGLIIPIKCKPNAIIPTKGTKGSAGYDLYAYLQDEKETNHQISISIAPRERRLISSGIMLSIPTGFYGRIAPRSGIAYKNGIDVLGGVIDSDYRNVVGVILLNTSSETFYVHSQDQIAQIIFTQCADAQFENVVDDFEPTTRTGGFGSTN